MSLKIHIGEKSFKCEHCDKHIVLNSNLTSHQITHIGKKPRKCDECHKSFSQKVYLVCHTMVRIKLYKCDQHY